ncbi:MAG: CHAT domain-containing protein, partial [Chloroflexota bacterium]
ATYRRAVTAAPQEPAPMFFLAMALARVGQWPEALAELTAARAADPSNTIVLGKIADLHLRNGDDVQAAEALGVLGDVLARKGWTDKAAEARRRASSLAPPPVEAAELTPLQTAEPTPEPAAMALTVPLPLAAASDKARPPAADTSEETAPEPAIASTIEGQAEPEAPEGATELPTTAAAEPTAPQTIVKELTPAVPEEPSPPPIPETETAPIEPAVMEAEARGEEAPAPEQEPDVAPAAPPAAVFEGHDEGELVEVVESQQQEETVEAAEEHEVLAAAALETESAIEPAEEPEALGAPTMETEAPVQPPEARLGRDRAEIVPEGQAELPPAEPEPLVQEEGEPIPLVEPGEVPIEAGEPSPEPEEVSPPTITASSPAEAERDTSAAPDLQAADLAAPEVAVPPEPEADQPLAADVMIAEVEEATAAAQAPETEVEPSAPEAEVVRVDEMSTVGETIAAPPEQMQVPEEALDLEPAAEEPSPEPPQPRSAAELNPTEAPPATVEAVAQRVEPVSPAEAAPVAPAEAELPATTEAAMATAPVTSAEPVISRVEEEQAASSRRDSTTTERPATPRPQAQPKKARSRSWWRDLGKVFGTDEEAPPAPPRTEAPRLTGVAREPTRTEAKQMAFVPTAEQAPQTPAEPVPTVETAPVPVAEQPAATVDGKWLEDIHLAEADLRAGEVILALDHQASALDRLFASGPNGAELISQVTKLPGLDEEMARELAALPRKDQQLAALGLARSEMFALAGLPISAEQECESVIIALPDFLPAQVQLGRIYERSERAKMAEAKYNVVATVYELRKQSEVASRLRERVSTVA